jgi:hypothetical protein
MEEQINRLITISLPNPGALEQARPNLFLRLAIARALYKPRTFDSLFNAAEALNTLRNRLAHHLEHPQIEAHINAFLRELESPEVPIEEFEREPTARRLKRCIALLCGQLYGICTGIAAVRDVTAA